MSAIPRRKLSEEEYLAIEDKAEHRSQFLDGEMFAMAGTSHSHNKIQNNLHVEFGIRLKGTSCYGLGSDMRVKVKATGLYTYPDYIIVCGEAQLEVIHGVETLLNPKVLFEVLSDSTEAWDRNMKRQHYERVESLQEYLLIDQHWVRVDHFVREGAELRRRSTTFDINDEIALTTLPIRVPLADIYKDVSPLAPPPKPGPTITE